MASTTKTQDRVSGYQLVRDIFPDALFLTTAQVAQVFGMSHPQSLRNALSRGSFPIKPFKHNGKTLVFDIRLIGEYLDSQLPSAHPRKVGRPTKASKIAAQQQQAGK